MASDGDQAITESREEGHALESPGLRKHALNDELEGVDSVPPLKQIKMEEAATNPIGSGQEDPRTDLASASVVETNLKQGGQTRPAESLKGGKQNKQGFEEPFKYLSSEHAELDGIYEFYGISPRFPRDRYMVRNATGEPNKAIYYTASSTKAILTENEGKSVKFVHAGIKMFVRQDVQRLNTCKWRIQMEGLPILEPWISEKRIVKLNRRQTLRKLLIEMFPKFSYGGWAHMGEIGERIRDIDPGCCVLRVEPSDDADGFRESIVLPLWKGLHSLNLMLPKEDRQAMLLRLFNEQASLQHPPLRPAQDDVPMAEDRPPSPADKEDLTASQDVDAVPADP